MMNSSVNSGAEIPESSQLPNYDSGNIAMALLENLNPKTPPLPLNPQIKGMEMNGGSANKVPSEMTSAATLENRAPASMEMPSLHAKDHPFAMKIGEEAINLLLNSSPSAMPSPPLGSLNQVPSEPPNAVMGSLIQVPSKPPTAAAMGSLNQVPTEPPNAAMGGLNQVQTEPPNAAMEGAPDTGVRIGKNENEQVFLNNMQNFPFLQEIAPEKLNLLGSDMNVKHQLPNQKNVPDDVSTNKAMHPETGHSMEEQKGKNVNKKDHLKSPHSFPFHQMIDPEMMSMLGIDMDVNKQLPDQDMLGQSASNETIQSDPGHLFEQQNVAPPKSMQDLNDQDKINHLNLLSSGFSFNVPVQYGPEVTEDQKPTSDTPLGFDVHRFRKDFPILHRKVNGKPLVWLDNGATTQKPNVVMEAITDYYERYNSNIHRGAHELAREATDAYEEAREKVRNFIGARTKDEIIFVRGTTEGINLVANSYGKGFLNEGDEIIISEVEHHANIVPWQFIAKEMGAKLVIARTNQNGDINMDEYRQLFNNRTRIVAVSQASNAIGTIVPVREMIKIAHSNSVPVLVDGAQSVQHMPVNVQDLDADFFVFSGHKIFAPMGIGVVYGKKELLEKMPPWQGGGAMIKDVTFEHTQFSEVPTKFEAGTPNVEGPIGLGAALDYLNKIGMHNIERYEHQITEYALRKLKTIPKLKLIGNPKKRISVLSFVIEGIENEVIGKELNQEGIAVRVGHHCAQPILRKMGHETAVRPSLAFYNTYEEIDFLIEIILAIIKKHS